MSDPFTCQRDIVIEIRHKMRDEYQNWMVGQEIDTLMQLTDLCAEIETRLANVEARSRVKNKWQNPSNSGIASKTGAVSTAKSQSAKNNKPKLSNNASNAKNFKDKPQYHCSFCSKDEHTVDRCWAKNGKPAAKGKPGQKAAAVVSEQKDAAVVRNVCSVIASTSDSARTISAQVEINGKKFKAMMDTGSRLSVIRADVARQLQLVPDGSSLDLAGADGRPLDCAGYVMANLSIRTGKTNEQANIQFAVMQNLCAPVLIGWRVMGWFKIAVSASRQCVLFEDEQSAPGIRLESKIEVPARTQKIIQAKVPKNVSVGIIEPSVSPWAAAYVLVRKKTGEIRLCIDFRRLNEQTKKNQYPLPLIEDCLEPLRGNKFFYQLDLASGYWQIKMAQEAREKTASRTEEGHFQFQRMPFGLCNAPASFQKLVNALFSGLKGVHLQVFIDDICVASKTWPEHLKMLEQVFELLEKANLRLKPSKCIFGANKVIFLGHELTRKRSVSVTPDLGKPYVY